MPIDSWTAPEDTPDLAAHAAAMIDAALVGTPLARDAYWAAVRKGYNTPYNDPPRRAAAPMLAPVLPNAVAPPPVLAGGRDEAAALPLAALAARAAEARAL